MFFIQPQYSITIYYCLYTISFIRFSAFVNHIYVVYSTKVSGFFIYSFVSLYSLNILFTETNLSWLMQELIKVLEIRILIVFNFVFASNTILSYFFFFFLIIHLYFWISGVVAQIFNHNAELVTHTEILTDKANAEIETQLLAARMKRRKCSK